MLENLSQRLEQVVRKLRGQTRLTEDNISEAMREVRMALLEADVALPVVKDFIAAVRAAAASRPARRWSAWSTANSPASWARSPRGSTLPPCRRWWC